MLEISLLSIILLLIFGGVFLAYRYTNSLRNDITKIQGIVEKLDSSQIVSTVQQVQGIIDNFCTNGIKIGKGEIWHTNEWPHFHFPDQDLTLGGKNQTPNSIGAKICEMRK